ncbi:carboxylesterase/lipase family protein [Microbacterium sp. 22303]|uniref:carboxylesterase/lipase family protein n=1 Tax=Microbacterium sp. 22303 TaxID=3453905 RepID=UPI003F850EAF
MGQDVVRTRISSGDLLGRRDVGIDRYLGVPYAAPPFGELHFRTPQPMEPWSAPRDAETFGPTAPQLPYAGATAEILGSVRIDGDDILTANVWAPADAYSAPVVLWIHGGALERGTAALSMYDGTAFARDGVVFVSVGYRLGSEGFSVLEGAPRNLGLQDVAAALHWVRDEIAAFGGDPNRITLMGESAGGALVAALLSRPDTRALVRGAIVQSGPLEAQTPERGGRVTQQLAKRLGVAATREAFTSLTPDALLEARRAQSAGSSPLGGAPGFQLVLDPDSLPRSPHEALADVDVPLLIGTNTDEYRLWFPPEALAAIRPSKLLLARLALRIPAAAARAVRADHPGGSTGEVFGQLATDLLLRAPAARVARARTAQTFVYEFSWPSPVRDLRAAHALEIGFVFDRLRDPESAKIAGTAPPQALASAMHDAWVRFIRDGDPGWPAFDMQRTAALFDGASEGPAIGPQRRQTVLDLLPAPRG